MRTAHPKPKNIKLFFNNRFPDQNNVHHHNTWKTINTHHCLRSPRWLPKKIHQIIMDIAVIVVEHFWLWILRIQGPWVFNPLIVYGALQLEVRIHITIPKQSWKPSFYHHSEIININSLLGGVNLNTYIQPANHANSLTYGLKHDKHSWSEITLVVPGMRLTSHHLGYCWIMCTLWILRSKAPRSSKLGFGSDHHIHHTGNITMESKF